MLRYENSGKFTPENRGTLGTKLVTFAESIVYEHRRQGQTWGQPGTTWDHANGINDMRYIRADVNVGRLTCGWLNVLLALAAVFRSTMGMRC